MEETRPLTEHLEELRLLVLRLLMVWGGATLLSSFYISPLMSFLLAPYQATHQATHQATQVTFLLLSPLEGWWTGMFVAILGGILLALPLLLYLVMSYLLPAFYPEESKKIFYLGGFLLLFSLLGFCVGHLFFAPFVIETLQASTLVPGTPAYAIREAIHFVVSIDLGVMTLFNLMGGLTLLVLKGWVKVEWLASYRRSFILGAFILGAILTPPDILSQVMMAAGLILGFEAVLLLGRLTSFLHAPSHGDHFHPDSSSTDLLLEQKSPEGL